MSTNRAQDSFVTVTREQLWKVATSKEPLIPELDAARSQRSTLLVAPQTRQALTRTQGLLSASEHIPQTSYTAFRLFRRTGDRSLYEEAYFTKREYLAALVLRL